MANDSPNITAMPTASKTKKIATWSILALLLAVVAIKTFFIGYHRIPQNGMYPGLPAGSSVFAAHRAMTTKQPTTAEFDAVK